MEQLLYQATTLLNAASLIKSDRSTELAILPLVLLPARAKRFCGVEVVAAMVPHDLKGGSYAAFRYSTSNSICGIATNRSCSNSARNLKGDAAKKVIDRLAETETLQELHAKDDMPVWRRGQDNRPYTLRITKAGLKAIEVEDVADAPHK